MATNIKKIRDGVVKAKEKAHNETKKFMGELANALKRYGYKAVLEYDDEDNGWTVRPNPLASEAVWVDEFGDSPVMWADMEVELGKGTARDIAQTLHEWWEDEEKRLVDTEE